MVDRPLDASAVAGAPGSDPGGSGAPDCILVVDDDDTLCLFVSELLGRNGFTACTATTAATALAVAAEHPPSLILLDVMLPDQDGFSLCRELKAAAATADVPVIFLTAKGDDAEMVHGFAAGGVDYIVKPFEPAVLLARVRTHTTLARLSRGLAETLAERTVRLEEANHRLRELNLEMARIEERERRRLADDLHDTTIQQLVLARILIDADPGGDTERDGRLRELVDLSLGQLRTLVFELSPPVLRQAGLYPALEWLAEGIRAQWSLPVTCALRGIPVALPESAALALFRSARELLVNAAKHARARAAAVELGFEAGEVELVVRDDGIGLDRRAPPDAEGPGGFGLRSLRSRIELLGGRLDLGGGDGGRVRIRLPLAAGGHLGSEAVESVRWMQEAPPLPGA